MSVGAKLENAQSNGAAIAAVQEHLDTQTSSAAILAIVFQIGKCAAQLAGMILLARLVAPSDYGAFSIAVGICAFGLLFKDGLNLAAVQAKHLNNAESSNLFWTNVAIGLPIAVLTACIAPLVAHFYGSPALTFLVGGLAVGQVFAFASNQHVVLLRRQMRFGVLGAVDQGATIVAVGTALYAAFCGAGVWSLLILQVVIMIGTAIGAFVSARWVPSLYDPTVNTASLLGFGKDVTFSDVATYATRNFDNLLIGRCCGVQQLGFYDRAYTLMLIPLQQLMAPLAGVFHSSLSKIQSETDKYKTHASNVLSINAVIGMFASAFLFVHADKLIPALIGNAWQPAVPVIQCLAPSGFIDAGVMGVCIVLLSTASTRPYLHLKVLAAVVGISAFFLGIPWGTAGVAAAFSLSRAIVLAYGVWLCSKYTPVTARNFISALRLPALTTAAAAVLTIGFDRVYYASSSNIYLQLIGSAACFFVTFFAFWNVDSRGRAQMRDLAGRLAGFLRRS